MHTRSRSRKRTLDQAEEEVVVAKEVFEEVLVEEKVEEEALIAMGEPKANTEALMDYSQPKINDIQSSIVRPSISANTIDIKLSTIQMI